jgi:hypothetical protein
MQDFDTSNILDDDKVEITDLCDCATFPGTAGFDFQSSFRDPGSGSILLSTYTFSCFYRRGFLDKGSNLDQVLQWRRSSKSSACRDHRLASL